MTPAFRTAGKPALRKSSFALLLLCTSALAGCATNTPPPEISYDNIETVWGMDIIVCTTARTNEEAKALLTEFGFPFRT